MKLTNKDLRLLKTYDMKTLLRPVHATERDEVLMHSNSKINTSKIISVTYFNNGNLIFTVPQIF